MRLRRWITFLVCYALLATVLGSGPTHAFDEGYRIATTLTPTEIALPVATDGATVVWLSMSPEWSVMAARLTDRQPFTVVTLDSDFDYSALLLDVSHDLVVWGPDRDRNIHGTSLTTGDDRVLAVADPTVTSIAVSGDWLVWQGGDGMMTWIKARDIRSMDAPVILAEAPVGDYPVIGNALVDAGWIVWGEDYDVTPSHEGYRTLAYQRIASDEPAHRIDISDLLYPGRITLSNDLVAYPVAPSEPNLPGQYAWASAKIISLTHGESYPVTIRFAYPDAGGSRTYPYAAVEHMAFDGRFVIQPFVTSIPTGSAGLPVQIVAHDYRYGGSFVLNEGNLRLLTADDGVVAWASADGCCAQSVYALRRTELMPSNPVPDTRPPSPDYRYFPETGHYLGHGFKSYWEQSGGLPVFGYPLTEEFSAQNAQTGRWHTTQVFERAIFEWHPENHGTPYEVLLRTFSYSWTNQPYGDPADPHYFAATNHHIEAIFWDYWSTHGLEFGDPGVSMRESLALFGYPLSQMTTEVNPDGDTVQMQMFERAVFEYHPDNPDPWKILLRRSGAEQLHRWGW